MNAQADALPKESRQSLIETAALFLSNKDVINTSLQSRRDFLAKKGLNEAEIDNALLQAQTLASEGQSASDQTSSSRLRDWSLMILAIGGAVCGCYALFKSHIQPYVMGTKSTAEDDLVINVKWTCEALASLESKISELQLITERQDSLLKKMQKDNDSTANVRSMQEIKEEVLSLKKLLLSRSQFPSLPKPSISLPSWQLNEHVNVILSSSAEPSATCDFLSPDRRQSEHGVVLSQDSQENHHAAENGLTNGHLSPSNTDDAICLTDVTTEQPTKCDLLSQVSIVHNEGPDQLDSSRRTTEQ